MKSYGYFRMDKSFYVYNRANTNGKPQPLKSGHKHYLVTNVESIMKVHIEKINSKRI